MTTTKKLQVMKEVEERNEKRLRTAKARAEIYDLSAKISSPELLEALALILRYVCEFFYRIEQEAATNGGDAK